MKYFTKTQMILTAVFSLVLAFGFATPAYAYTDQEIADAVIYFLEQGYSNAEIAAIAESYDVSASDITSAAENLGYGDVSEAVEQAFEQVVTVTVNDTNYYTTVGESTNVYTAPTADAGGANPIGTFNTNTGQFTDTNGATANITDITGSVTVSVTNAGGTVTTTVNDQAWDTVVGATVAGLTYLSCAASGATGCLGSYISSGGANVSITNLTPAQRLACRPATAPSSVSCSQYAGSSLGGVAGIPSNYTAGDITYSIDSCGILTNVDVSACRSPSAPIITSFTPSPTGFSAGTGGGPVTLEWASTNTERCTASGGWSGIKDTSGRETINNVRVTTIYTLTCSGPGGTTTR